MSPTYSFRCAYCGTKEERFVPMSKRASQVCSKCGKPLAVIITAPIRRIWGKGGAPS